MIDVIITILFVIFIFLTCKLYGNYVIRQYKKKQIIKRNKELKPEYYSCNLNPLKLNNKSLEKENEYSEGKAISKINIMKNIKIKVN